MLTYAIPLLVNDLRKPERVDLLSLVQREAVSDGRKTYYEELLQGLIHSHPECLPIRDIEPAFAGMKSVCRELKVRCGGQIGYVDNLLMNADGRICLIECKLQQNREAEREVVGQILSYAAALTKIRYNDLVEGVRQARSTMKDPPLPLAEAVLGPAAADEDKLQQFREGVERSLKRGSFLLIVAGDRIRSGVEDIASLLQENATLSFSFGLVEMPIYSANGQGPYVVQPRLIAQTEVITRTVFLSSEAGQHAVIEKVQPPGRPGTLSEAEFYGELAKHNGSYPDQLRVLLDQLRDSGCDLKLLRKMNVYVDDINGGQVSVGGFSRDGTLEIWGVAGKDKDRGAPLGQRYMEQVAAAFGGCVNKTSAKPSDWNVRVNEKVGIPLSIVFAHANEWLRVIEEFNSSVRQRIDQEQ